MRKDVWEEVGEVCGYGGIGIICKTTCWTARCGRTGWTVCLRSEASGEISDLSELVETMLKSGKR